MLDVMYEPNVSNMMSTPSHESAQSTTNDVSLPEAWFPSTSIDFASRGFWKRISNFTLKYRIISKWLNGNYAHSFVKYLPAQVG